MFPLKAFLIEDRQFLKTQYDSKNVSSVILQSKHWQYWVSFILLNLN